MEIEGSGGADSPVGTNGPDQIFGNGRNDTLAGLAGDDDIFGGDGEDVLLGSSDDDLVFEGMGTDMANSQGFADITVDLITGTGHRGRRRHIHRDRERVQSLRRRSSDRKRTCKCAFGQRRQ